MTVAVSQEQSWIEYWRQDEFWADNPLWMKNADFFMKLYPDVFNLGRQDTVLNIGCGAGYLDFLLASRVKELCAIDVSSKFIELTKKRCALMKNVRTAMLGENYTDLSQYGNFSVFLCNSVVQYYQNYQELESLILSARACALPGARMLITDLPQPDNLMEWMGNVSASVGKALRYGYLGEILRTGFSCFLAPNAYSDFSSKARTLVFNRSGLEKLVRGLGLHAQVLPESFSVSAKRLSLLIEFGNT